jgi:hypothetical protein
MRRVAAEAGGEYPMATRAAAIAVCLVMLLAGCGDGRLTESEYASRAADLVADMEARFVALDLGWESEPLTVEGAQRYWEDRLQIRADFLGGIAELAPPEHLDDLHATALDLFRRLTAADEAVAQRVAGYEEVTDHWQWDDTPEGQAVLAVLAEVFEFCRTAQADFDATSERESLDDVPWVPAEMKDVVEVAFGCPPP